MLDFILVSYVLYQFEYLILVKKKIDVFTLS
jgi:hypothetical protein